MKAHRQDIVSICQFLGLEYIRMITLFYITLSGTYYVNNNGIALTSTNTVFGACINCF